MVTYSLHRPQKHPLEKKVQRWLMRAIFVYTPRL
nr:MAG TPA: hypothetical protein [Caudoviricetes sp.]DAZ53418.1 MAG TPA: hypothetical protein [Caudoviricetes sp.]